MTTRLAAFQAGQTLDIWGPLGNGFPPQNGGHLIMVAGGIGQTPFMAMARESLGKRSYRTPHRQATPATSVTLCYGARQADYLAGVEDFRTLGVDVRVSTDDGSAGHHGLVTDLLSTVLNERAAAQTLRDSRIICCGPEKMMQAVADIAKQRGVACQVSLETPMACGIGICFSCVTRVRQGDGQWDYRRTCVEGPVFDAAEIVWQA
jgi:dihydroorotate dehydrogenase electron transfer subunit